MDTMDRLWETAERERRTAVDAGVGTAVVTGFAASVQPVMTQSMILTDPAGLDHGMIEIATANGPVAAYRALPAGGKRLPLILVVQEIFGLHEHIKDICRRFAKLGYCAVAPSLYDRQGDVTGLTSFDDIRAIVARVPDAQVMADLDATAAASVAAGHADPARIAITGFCWGGRITWLYAAHNPALKAGVAWYGRVTGDKTANQPAHPTDLAARIRAPVLGLYGSADAGIPVPTLDALSMALGPASPSRIHVYPDAPHAFFADYRPSYRPTEAANAWRRCTTWLKDHGV